MKTKADELFEWTFPPPDCKTEHWCDSDWLKYAMVYGTHILMVWSQSNLAWQMATGTKNRETFDQWWHIEGRKTYSDKGHPRYNSETERIEDEN